MDLGMPELIFIFGLALLLFGPAQLPKLGRQLGKALGDFKRASNEFKHQLEDEVRDLELAAERPAPPPPDPPAGTVAKGAIEPADARSEHAENSIQPPDAAAAKPAGDHVA
jgi:TatA/E family protein of Tat protein translocase